jgi:hypothetical protein
MKALRIFGESTIVLWKYSSEPYERFSIRAVLSPHCCHLNSMHLIEKPSFNPTTTNNIGGHEGSDVLPIGGTTSTA